MRLANEGLELAFDAPDGPAVLPADRKLCVVVRPPSPLHAVEVLYRMNGGPMRSLHAVDRGVDHESGTQRFAAVFPESPGAIIEYLPVLHSAGRRVPASSDARLPGRLVLPSAPAAQAPAPAPAVCAAEAVTFVPALTRVGGASIRLADPQVVGRTPEGFRVNFSAAEATVRGDQLDARVIHGVDYMLVRPDGMGLLDIHALLETHDGARLDVRERGLIDFGPDGFARACAGQYPEPASLQLATWIATEDPRYAWVNRVQFVSVGEAQVSRRQLRYDIYMMTTTRAAHAR